MDKNQRVTLSILYGFMAVCNFAVWLVYTMGIMIAFAEDIPPYVDRADHVAAHFDFLFGLPTGAVYVLSSIIWVACIDRICTVNQS